MSYVYRKKLLASTESVLFKKIVRKNSTVFFIQVGKKNQSALQLAENMAHRGCHNKSNTEQYKIIESKSYTEYSAFTLNVQLLSLKSVLKITNGGTEEISL